MAGMCGRAGEPALRKGPWTLEEDLILVSYISQHGEGSWDSLARSAGLNRNGKSCRLRWLNYLRPGVRRGSISAEEDALIRELHARWGNKWSKISKHLPGRTDNEVKNYWRTRIQKKPLRSHHQQQQQQHQPCLQVDAMAMAKSEAASVSVSTCSQSQSKTSSTVGDGYMQMQMNLPYVELSSVADHLETVDVDAMTMQFFSSEFSDNLWNVVDGFWETL